MLVVLFEKINFQHRSFQFAKPLLTICRFTTFSYTIGQSVICSSQQVFYISQIFRLLQILKH